MWRRRKLRKLKRKANLNQFQRNIMKRILRKIWRKRQLRKLKKKVNLNQFQRNIMRRITSLKSKRQNKRNQKM